MLKVGHFGLFVQNVLSWFLDTLISGNVFNNDGKFIGNIRNDGKDATLLSTNFDFSPKVFSTLKSKFGIHNFRPNQVSNFSLSLSLSLRRTYFLYQYQLVALVWSGCGNISKLGKCQRHNISTADLEAC
jgi:hypothetical protein